MTLNHVNLSEEEREVVLTALLELARSPAPATSNILAAAMYRRERGIAGDLLDRFSRSLAA